MARAPKGKTGKAAAPPPQPSQLGKRRKKKYEPPPTMRRSASASSSTSSGAASPREEGPGPTITASAAGSGANTPSAHGKECEQCGNCMVLDGVAAARAWPTGKKSTASTGCQICDFVAFRKSQRPCVACARVGCDHFCDWCGHGFHAKCAKQRGEQVGGPDGFCCRKCEAEQENPGDTSASEDDGEDDELGARCGSCRLPFNGAAPVAKAADNAKPAGPSGFRVNQSVLVDNEDMLYNAVITAVDTKSERIKIHFIRWSKSFDDWYAMDDERINESLACDCCNQWFHIGCLPPIKSTGRWKESTYVCPTCIEDARAFHNGSRAVLKAKTAYISTSLAIANSSGNGANKPARKAADTPADATSKAKAKKSAKPDRDDDSAKATDAVSDKTTAKVTAAPVVNKRKRKLSEASSTESPRKKKEGAPALTKRASSSSSSPSSPSPTAAAEISEAVAPAPEVPADADATASIIIARSDAATEPAEEEKPAAKDKNSAAEAAPAARKDAPAPSPRVASDSTASTPAPEQSQTSPKPGNDGKTPRETPSSPPKNAADKPPSTPSKKPAAVPPPAPSAATSNEQTPVAPAKREESTTSAATEETHRRRGSGHSMSSLLNSPAPDEERPQPPFKPTITSLPMIIPHRPSPETIKMMVAAALPPPAGRDPPVKLERDLFPPAPRSKSAAKKEPSARSRATKKSAAANARGSLSAFDILREVATQSMSGDIADAPPGAKPKRERSTAQTESAAVKRAKMDAATSTSSPAQAPAAVPGSEAERLAHATRERIQMNSFVDLHFNIRKEMYLRFCRLEEEGLLTRDTAHLLRALIYPTSDKFQDLKFVYLVNKDLPSDQLTKRLLEVVPATSGGKGPAALAAALLPPPPAPGHHLPHHRVAGPQLSSMSLFSAGVSRNVSPAGTPRMGLLPHGASLTDRLAESAIRSPLRSTVVSGPAPIPGSIKSDAGKEARANVNANAAGKRPDILMMERQAQPQAPPSSVPNQARAGAQLISR